MENNLETYPAAVAQALQHQLGGTHQAVKTVMRWTGAGERTVKNWFAGSSGSSDRLSLFKTLNAGETPGIFGFRIFE